MASGVHFRVWAADHQAVTVIFDDAGVAPLSLAAEADGYFSGFAEGVGPGARYRFKLGNGETLLVDPVSWALPEGPDGPSEVVDSQFRWTDKNWKGVSAVGQVLYELHVGTFTQAGTWQSAIEQLTALRELGITCTELMPVNEFPGTRNWGYDGVNQFAPYHGYGSPDDFRRFVDSAHGLGIGVILDVVYNHFGPGQTITAFSKRYFNDRQTNWGQAINFDGPGNGAVREFFLTNVRYWIEQFHLDGFRFDATQAIFDTSAKHILAEINEVARAAAPHKTLYLVNENEPQDSRLFMPESEGGYGLDANWNDDFHHAAGSLLTGHCEAYYRDHPGKPQEFISGAKYGFIYQGQRYGWQSKRRGRSSLSARSTAFVHFLQNHDQIANSARGFRVHRLASPQQLRAMTALLLLGPQTPMLFQGQEWAASSPFLYFSDQSAELRGEVAKGRAKELSQFPSIATPEALANLRDPSAIETFNDSKLKHEEKSQPAHAEWLALHRDLIALRQGDAVFSQPRLRGDIDGAVLGPDAFVLRFSNDGDDRLLVLNLGQDLNLDPCPEPLMAPPTGMRWAVVLATEDFKYGGCGWPPPETEQEGWFLHGRSAFVLKPMPAGEAGVASRIVGHSSSAESEE